VYILCKQTTQKKQKKKTFIDFSTKEAAELRNEGSLKNCEKFFNSFWVTLP